MGQIICCQRKFLELFDCGDSDVSAGDDWGEDGADQLLAGVKEPHMDSADSSLEVLYESPQKTDVSIQFSVIDCYSLNTRIL